MYGSPFGGTFNKEYKAHLEKIGLSTDTIRFYLVEGEKYFVWCTNEKRPIFNKESMEAYQEFLNKKYSKYVYIKKISALNSFIRFAENYKLLTDQEKDIIRPYLKDEIHYIRTIIKVAGKNITRNRNLFAFELALHGLSLREIVNIRKSHINLFNQVITLPTRTVSFHSETDIQETYIRWQKQRDEYVGTDCHDPLLITTLRDFLSPLRQSILIKSWELISQLGNIEVSIERLNATHLYYLVNANLSLEEIKEQSGPHVQRLSDTIAFIRSFL